MSSSEDEDCYGNIAKKLQCLKNSYRPERPAAKVLATASFDCEPATVLLGNVNTSEDDSYINLLEDVPTVPDTLVPAKIAPKTKTARRSTRSRRSDLATDSQLPAPKKRGRKRKNDDTTPEESTPVILTPPTLPVALPTLPVALPTLPVAPPTLPVAPPTLPVAPITVEAVSAAISSAIAATAQSTGGRRGRGARGGRRGGAGRGRGGRRSLARQLLESFIINPTIYSVGNTAEYPDSTENVPIFSKNSDSGASRVMECVDLSSSIEEENENEEMSVKVCWQQMEYVKFNIRRFQKLSQIFEFFSERERVSSDRLLFTLRGRVLRPADTPDSVQYGIAQFIDGGIVNSSMASIARAASNKENAASGILVKFQCQNSKKPFETHIEAHQKLSTAMLKCAEHFELPYAKLRFILDGDCISPSSTPQDHGLDHGDCIDVKLVT